MPAARNSENEAYLDVRRSGMMDNGRQMGVFQQPDLFLLFLTQKGSIMVCNVKP